MEFTFRENTYAIANKPLAVLIDVGSRASWRPLQSDRLGAGRISGASVGAARQCAGVLDKGGRFSGGGCPRRNPVKVVVVAFGLLAMVSVPSVGKDALGVETVNSVRLSGKTSHPGRAVLIKAEVLLDRAHFSPGVIDGTVGDNLHRAVVAYQRKNGLHTTGNLDPETWTKLTDSDQDAVLMNYTITQEDIRGPFVKKIPTKMEEQASLKRLAYRSPTELLAEKFHMSEGLLQALNHGKTFEEAGTTITVAEVQKPDAAAQSNQDHPKAAKIIVEKGNHDLMAFDAKGGLIAYYPASVGSEEKPAPSGTLVVTRIVRNPTYTYNPTYHFKHVKAKHEFTIKPGPNNPVGVVWIALTGEGYGIHGTPEPDRVGKTASHGCIRLTNWDALDLASMVEKKTPVEFVD
jgi:lipoprotein-anchoring transpeptidase ErfK/SrfK